MELACAKTSSSCRNNFCPLVRSSIATPRTPSRLWSASRMVDPSFSHKAGCFALSAVWAAAWAVKLTETRQRKKIAFTILSPARDEIVHAVYRVHSGEISSDMNQRVAKRARMKAHFQNPAACSEHGRSRWTESQPWLVRKDEFSVLHSHSRIRVIRDQQVPVQVGVVDERRQVRRGRNADRTRHHTAKHGFHSQRFRHIDAALRFLDAATFIELHVYAVIGIHEVWHRGSAQASLVRNNRDVHVPSYPTRLFQHRGRHGLLHKFHPLRFQPVDL